MSAPAPITSIPEQSGNSLTNPSRLRSRKTRIVRRRGRAKFDESDEEIEREVTSDDESDDDHSSLASASESESLSEDGHLNGRSEVVTPSTTQSPPPLDIDGRTPLAGSKRTSIAADSGPFVAATDWADMVTAEHANGAEELPVIDFADLDRQRIDQHLISPHPAPKKPRKQAKPRGQTARQAYQQRLETDPSFVPKVGEFWGHDDRLLDKDLRSLSGWWRGRWQSRGRGRGAPPMRGGRGRGVFFGGRNVDHDGFEEMKRRDEKRLEVQRSQEQEQTKQQQQQSPQVRFGRNVGGFFGGRGRGSFARGGSGSTSPVHAVSNMPAADRIWFAMKPERMWTKQHEAFLYFDTALKPRPGMGPGYRVKLPGSKDHVVRAPPRHTIAVSVSPEDERSDICHSPTTPSRQGEGYRGPAPAPTPEILSIEEVFTVRPNLVPNRRINLSTSQPQPSANHIDSVTAVSSTTMAPPPRSLSSPRVTSLPSASSAPRSDLFALQPPVVLKETVLRRASISTQSSSVPAAPVLQADDPRRLFSRLCKPTSLRVGLNQHGMPYELATGRPVYLHQPTPPPPPPPMFTPRPVMYTHTPHPSMSAPFVPGHMHHPSHSVASPDPYAQSHTPPVQLLTLRLSSRIEIRAPVDTADGKKHSSRPSGLRVSSSESVGASRFEREAASDSRPEFAAPNGDAQSANPSVLPQGDPALAMGYYPQQYYYPDPYAYPAYMDVSPQVMPYEMFPSDHRAHHQPQPPMIYY
ncbi:uncharacterized protein B0H18DRAFT_965099 [Fomitopsis serialis]|uniref:uncharacterized protein n=1 Tax=Fomitopsis serialis TaxID=139415 RepID=UPI002008068A|nr:uncharacterized protein B0H18DRAFT_965099 [Neoantrodia serialis]KAH9938014.1 hypothetical protein B0H18DRAFT_965099 [Neoantrodia serialis]